jgi:sterol desaturase/sphingolipid hydroxylase (fatty acid hydroxylase superfamily)
MSRYQDSKEYSKKLFIDAYDMWRHEKEEFLLNFVLLTIIIACIGALAFLAIWGLIAGAIALYNVIQGDILILFYIVSAIAFIVAIPAGVVFLGKHFKANQE